jgi:hypothetical protein
MTSLAHRHAHSRRTCRDVIAPLVGQSAVCQLVYGRQDRGGKPLAPAQNGTSPRAHANTPPNDSVSFVPNEIRKYPFDDGPVPSDVN